MSKEESKLVDEVIDNQSTEEKTAEGEFNPLAFVDDVYGSDTKDNSEDTGEVSKEDEDGWSWEEDQKEKESEEVVEEAEEEYDWEDTTNESTEESTEEEKLNWEKVGKELGIEINSKEDLINAMNSMQKESKPVQEDNQISQLRGYLKLSDRDLVAEELRHDGIEEHELEESIDKLEDSGMLKMKAKSVRRVLNQAIDQHNDRTKKERANAEVQKKESITKAKEGLKTQIKEMNEFMGGKVTKKQKEEIYRFATGDMMNEIWKDHANVADVAMFMLYREQIEKILRSQGLADGKAAIMDSIVSPSLNTGKNKSNFKVESGSFDPKAFMNE
jgi:hypothetical protein